jgi:hypothetical protein
LKSSIRHAALPLGAALAFVGIGFLTASALENPDLSSARTVGLATLGSAGIVAGLALQLGRSARAASIGFGFLFAALTLAGAYLLGLLTHGDKIVSEQARVGPYSGLAVAAFVVGGLALTVLRDPIRSNGLALLPNAGGLPRGLIATGLLFVVVGLVDLVTGTVPLLASNVDAARFAGTGGVFTKVSVWTIGGLEWIVVAAGVTIFFVRARQRSALALFVGGFAILALLAGRSFLVICAFSLVVAWGVTGRLTLVRVLAISSIGLVALGVAGSIRVAHSDPTGARRAYLRSHGLTGVGGFVSLSASTGPYVFGESIQAIPHRIGFQGGRFFLRDFRATMPSHPFGRPMRSDEWVTVAVLDRDPRLIGGSPPTLAGGLYIDFGLAGVLAGCAALGVALTGLFRWTVKTGTRAALGLYSYLSAYVALSAYSYISLKPTVLVVTAMFLIAHRGEIARRGYPSRSAIADAPNAARRRGAAVAIRAPGLR